MGKRDNRVVSRVTQLRVIVGGYIGKEAQRNRSLTLVYPSAGGSGARPGRDLSLNTRVNMAPEEIRFLGLFRVTVSRVEFVGARFEADVAGRLLVPAPRKRVFSL